MYRTIDFEDKGRKREKERKKKKSQVEKDM